VPHGRQALSEAGIVEYSSFAKTHSIIAGSAIWKMKLAAGLGLFDERNLLELTHHPDYPGERLVACRNPQLAKLRAYKRQSLLEATQKELEKVRERVQRGRLKGQAAIGLRVGRVLNKYKVAKHFVLEIAEKNFKFHLLEEQIAAEAALDGIYGSIEKRVGYGAT